MAELERHDIQGLVVSSYIHLSCAAYGLLRIANPAGARQWLGRLVGEITTAAGRQPGTSINIAFTHSGLRKLGLDQAALDTFARPFLEGMATEYRARILGDRGDSAPPNWNWGNAHQPVDILLLLFAEDDTMLDTLIDRQREEFVRDGGVDQIMLLEAGRQADSREHFGFNDGIGQPVIEGSGKKARQLDRTHHATELPPGEFLLGYLNAYGVTADSPFVEPTRDPQGLLPVISPDRHSLHNAAGMHDLGRNGSYLVFRQMAQHVADFWQFLDAATRKPDGSRDPEACTRLGAKFVGRWPSGAPLVKWPDRDPDAESHKLNNENDFAYYETDPDGLACPIGSHIRRSNPRDALGPDPRTALASANRHRLMRRGRSYGDRLADRFVDDGVERGIHFICLNSDIERQFEFVQHTWINNQAFGGLYNEVDPLIGNLDRTNGVMTVQADPLRQRVHNLRRFITVKGGGYFFLPGIKTLHYLARLASSSPQGAS
ncbi:MAG: Dyp-type peroxidase [Chloroflexota bacterium]|nr:Dyp-type peroxidase [Chloroflexota bacterium]